MGSGTARDGLGSVPVVPGDVQLAFAQAAAEDGIVLGNPSFDWLCEQGHVGLERVAKARLDPALVGPVTAALEQLGAIYARLKGDISVPRLVLEDRWRYLSGFAPAIQMMTRVNFPSGPTSKKLQLCISFLAPSRSSPM